MVVRGLQRKQRVVCFVGLQLLLGRDTLPISRNRIRRVCRIVNLMEARLARHSRTRKRFQMRHMLWTILPYPQRGQVLRSGNEMPLYLWRSRLPLLGNRTPPSRLQKGRPDAALPFCLANGRLSLSDRSKVNIIEAVRLKKVHI